MINDQWVESRQIIGSTCIDPRRDEPHQPLVDDRTELLELEDEIIVPLGAIGVVENVELVVLVAHAAVRVADEVPHIGGRGGRVSKQEGCQSKKVAKRTVGVAAWEYSWCKEHCAISFALVGYAPLNHVPPSYTFNLGYPVLNPFLTSSVAGISFSSPAAGNGWLMSTKAVGSGVRVADVEQASAALDIEIGVSLCMEEIFVTRFGCELGSVGRGTGVPNEAGAWPIQVSGAGRLDLAIARVDYG
ncbi:hypothetical protein FIBSPDRAFT_901364 [Athelia psychrophila]|uniref:Uncharacterized protein n=1 Tax=Athelia psychrophila TaxID=1759441 RepID=A0A165X7C6_9AGAM|nr:hypothetical protein FIBSPDRAFT_901364 [Fibularhizoctonia sp. CBS 109695]